MRIIRSIFFVVMVVKAITLSGLFAGKPNVIIFLSDDQGWGDLSINGNTNLSTPRIDSLAEQGATMSQFFVCQVCAPTRAEMLTGRYHPRTGVSGVSEGQERLNPDETTIANLFKDAGYATGAFGKWHNGTQPPYHPNYRGFDEYYGFTSGHWGHYFSPPLDHNGKKVRGNGFIVDDFTDHALAFIEQNKERPFFCYIPYNTPHSPMMVPDEWYEKFDGMELKMLNRDPEREEIEWTRAALAMCENIDWNVGRVLDKLQELELANDTIVIYFSDNGPNSFRWNGGFKGKKGAIDEGGVRSPFFIRWPGKIPGGARFNNVAGAIDLLPTLTELAGIEARTAKPIDGISLAGLLTGKQKNLPDRSIFSVKMVKDKPAVSVRTDRFRLDENGQLFDMVNDIGQRVDVSKQHPELASSLAKAADQHGREMARLFRQFEKRPFSVGYAGSTTLPARDGIPHGTIQRSVSAPNNSFFKNWTSKDDSITWDVVVENTGTYQAIVYYTCAEGDQGATVRLGLDDGDSTQAKVTEVWDPPLYEKPKERVAESHYFVKDFKPLELGSLRLKKGTGTLRLGSLDIKGKRVIDVFGIELVRIE